MTRLRERFEQAQPGEERLVKMRGSGSVRRTIEATIQRSGVKPLSGLFRPSAQAVDRNGR